MLISTLVNRMFVPLRPIILSIFVSIYPSLIIINMKSFDKLSVDDLTTVLVPLTVADIKYLRNIFESWIALIGKPNDKAQYLFHLLGLMLRSLDLVISLPSSSENGEVSVH